MSSSDVPNPTEPAAQPPVDPAQPAVDPYAQPAQTAVPASGEALPPFPSATPQAPKGPGLLRRILVPLAIFALLFVGWRVWGGSGVGAPKAGECITATSDNKTDTIACTDAKAQYKVLGVVNNKSESEFNADTQGTMCAAWPDATHGFYSGINGNGYVLCVQQITK